MLHPCLPVLLALVFGAPARGQELERYFLLLKEADRSLVAGEYEAAAQAFEGCEALFPKSFAARYGRVCVWARQGRAEEALELLAEIERPEPELVEWDPDLASLRDQPRFEEVLEELRAQALYAKPSLWTREIECEGPGLAFRGAVLAPDGGHAYVGCWSGELIAIECATGRRVWTLELGDAPVWKVAMRTDGAEVAVLDGDGTLSRVDVATRKVIGRSQFEPQAGLQRTRRNLFSCHLEYAPAGDQLLVTPHGFQSGGLYAADGSVLCSLDASTFFISVHAWGPQGRQLWWTDGSRLVGRDLETGDSLEAKPQVGEGVVSIAFDPRGAEVATGHNDGIVRIWSLISGELLRVTSPIPDMFGSTFRISTLAYAPAGEHLGVATTTGLRVAVLDPKTGEYDRVSDHLGGQMGAPGALSWSPDGTRLYGAFASGGMPLYCWNLSGETGGSFETSFRASVPQGGAGDLGVTWSGRRAWLLDMNTGRTRWIHQEQGPEGERNELRQTPEGYFDSESFPAVPMQLRRDQPWDAKMCSLQTNLVELFDPKRVRAACAGVRLSTPRLLD